MRELNKNIPPFLYGSRLTGERLASSNSNEAFCLHSDEGPIEIPSWLTVKDGQNTLHIYFSDLSLSENVLSQLIDNYFHMDKSTFAACLEKTDDNGHTVLISIIKYRSNLLLNKLLDIYKNDLGMWRFIRIMETTDDLREIGLSLTKARTPDILILRRLKNIVPFSLLKDNVLFENLQNHSLHSLKSTVSLLGDTIYLASAVEALYFFDGLLKSSEETQNKFIIPAAINYLQLSNTDEGHIREALVNLLTYGKSREQYIQSLASSMALNQNAEEAYLIHNFLKYYLINNIELFNAIEDRYLQQIEQHEPPAPGC
jgi:hypothetical protein